MVEPSGEQDGLHGHEPNHQAFQPACEDEGDRHANDVEEGVKANQHQLRFRGEHLWGEAFERTQTGGFLHNQDPMCE